MFCEYLGLRIEVTLGLGPEHELKLVTKLGLEPGLALGPGLGLMLEPALALVLGPELAPGL